MSPARFLRLALRKIGATAPVGEGPKVIVHICNDTGGWGRGFVVGLSKRWSAPEAVYRRWKKGWL
ncbi:MAG: hypothetical protein AAFZ18_06900 [Myxococcota bacterium]